MMSDFRFIIIYNQAPMDQDLEPILPQQLDQEYAYYYKMISEGNPIQEKPSRDQEESSIEMESCSDTSGNKDLFKDPVYYRVQQPPSSCQANQEPSVQYYSPSWGPIKQVAKVEQAAVSVPCRTVNASGKKIQAKGKGGQPGKTKKLKKGKREQYPTKNFLPSFRSSFLNYLAKHFERSHFESFQIIQRIRGKPCINLQDYQDLFKEQAFRPILSKYFRDKVIVRDLMQSRIEYSTKCEYFKRIHVFERAFVRKEFRKINE